MPNNIETITNNTILRKGDNILYFVHRNDIVDISKAYNMVVSSSIIDSNQIKLAVCLEDQNSTYSSSIKIFLDGKIIKISRHYLDGNIRFFYNKDLENTVFSIATFNNIKIKIFSMLIKISGGFVSADITEKTTHLLVPDENHPWFETFINIVPNILTEENFFDLFRSNITTIIV